MAIINSKWDWINPVKLIQLSGEQIADTLTGTDSDLVGGYSGFGGARQNNDVLFGKTKSTVGVSNGITGGNTPNTPKNGTQPNVDLGYYGGGGVGGGGNFATADQLAEYDRGIDDVNHNLGRLSNQERIALENLAKKYGTATNELNSSFDRGKTQFNTQTTQNQQNRRTDVNNITDKHADGLRGIQRMLGSRGAVGTDMDLASRAVASEKSRELGGAGSAYAKNQQTLDTNWGNFQKDIDDERKKAQDWYNENQNSTKAAVATTRESLLRQLSTLRNQKQAAQGINGGSAGRADLDAARRLGGDIDNLARTNPTYTGRRVDYTPGSLDSYNVGATSTELTGGNASGGTDPFITQQQRDEEEKKRLGVY